MNENTEAIFKRLSFENLIWLIFIVIAILDIYGDELIKKSLIDNNNYYKEKANKLFIIITIVSFFIYCYFLKRNYKDYKKFNNKSYEIRLLGSCFFIAGSLCLLYFLSTTINQEDSLSNI